MSALNDFREETRAWLAEHCPPGARGEGQVSTGSSKITIQDPDVILWLDRMIERGWTVPTWPRAYGGAELSMDEYMIAERTENTIAEMTEEMIADQTKKGGKVITGMIARRRNGN
jgi:alkylation response protein AidB-like acyl-CoA dehydrogenase